MSTIYVSGIARWHKHKRTDKYGNYTVDLVTDKEARKLVKDAGLRLKPTEDDDGNLILKFRKRPRSFDSAPPVVVDAAGQPFEGDIGNGSEVTLKIEVYEFKGGIDADGNRYDGGVGHRWQGTRVDNLVVFEREGEPVQESNPAPKSGVPF